MRRWPGLAAAAVVFTLAAELALAALTYPALTGRVNDDANILTPEMRAALTRKLEDLENKSSIQLVVATVPSLQDTDVETFANGLFRSWKLGEAKSNNGALLLVAPNERKVRVEVGYGLESMITDALSSVIIASAIVPKFKTGDFSAGVERGVDALISAMTDDQSEWHKKVRVRPEADDSDLAFWLMVAFFLIVVVIAVRNSRGRGRGGPVYIPSGSWGGGGSSWGGGGSSWGGGGGGFDGGGFSGGGGSSGGGGASGSW